MALVQEEAGMHVGISNDLAAAAIQATDIFGEHYQAWRHRQRFSAWGHYKRAHFTVAVGGGNTVKAQYHAMVERLHSSVDWPAHVRFFPLSETTGESKRESAGETLIENFIVPLAHKLIANRGLRRLSADLEMAVPSSEQAIIDELVRVMVVPIDVSEAKRALRSGKDQLALRLARKEAERYQREIQNRLGATMHFHYIISGIGKNGAVGALNPYMPELAITEPNVTVLKPAKGALRVALNRGVLTNAEAVSLIISGNLKLRALGRFEMEEAANFEQTVMETPVRMFRESRELAERVYIFADENALHFEETQFSFRKRGELIRNKAETREGEDAKGPHVLLLHGFMGLFSFTNFLIRLPSAWTISALHRGSHAKNLDKTEVFPHYAQVLRHAILKIWRSGRPVPIAGHSIAGVMFDHLLLGLTDDNGSSIKPYAELSPQDRDLVDALRASGIIFLATWSPPDGLHTGVNIKNLMSHLRKHTDLDYKGMSKIYRRLGRALETTDEATLDDKATLGPLAIFLESRAAKPVINSLNSLLRKLLNNKAVQQRMLNANTPYVMRLVGNRLLKTASFYGLCKEIDAALQNPKEYHQRHLRALDILIEYDIPTLSIIHEDDFLVSARRHEEEHAFLVAQRKEKEGVTRAQDLQTTTRHVTIKRQGDELSKDPLNPHLLVMSTSHEGNLMAREVTSAMTQFVDENVEYARRRRRLKAIPTSKAKSKSKSKSKSKLKSKSTPVRKTASGEKQQVASTKKRAAAR